MWPLSYILYKCLFHNNDYFGSSNKASTNLVFVGIITMSTVLYKVSTMPAQWNSSDPWVRGLLEYKLQEGKAAIAILRSPFLVL